MASAFSAWPDTRNVRSGSDHSALANKFVSPFDVIAKASLPRPSFEFKYAAAGTAKSSISAGVGASDGRLTSDEVFDPDTDPDGRMAVDVDANGLCVRVGEDAYFVRKDGIGVADGVGGWSQVLKGSNASLFSSRLMFHVAAQLDFFDDFSNDYDINDYYNLDPVKVMQIACDRTLEDAGKGPSRAVGSTTAMIAFIRDDELRIASLGDASLMILRNGEMIFRTEEQQHSFNFPFQLGSDSKDTPEKDAVKFAVKIKEGDVVVMGSDGIFDNLFDEDILDAVNAVVLGSPAAAAHPHAPAPVHPPKPPAPSRILRTDPQQIASAILAHARQIAMDSSPTVTSPFQERAVEEGIYYQGGKVDDLTVVVGIVRIAEDSPDRR
ncbi:hypothetical protein HDU83_005993 [Entophlyctis luteolus]|nr:hypothetical protein HDU83_005993 [Entophlyctis luteolus]